jgi:hypothetical protein
VALDRPLGWSIDPALNETWRPWLGFQNNAEPHTLQKPRSACSDERYQLSRPVPVMARLSAGAAE